MTKPTVLITGCSDGSLGSALALEFHRRGHRVFATARNPAKLTAMKAAGIETLILDVQSSTSITACVETLSNLTSGKLDILVNNAGAATMCALTDASIAESRQHFDLNVWAPLEVTQAFLPLLLRSTRPGGAIIANNTSGAGVVSIPFQGVYGAGKAAVRHMSKCLRVELAPWDVNVVEIVTGATKSNINDVRDEKVPEKGSVYTPAKEWLDEWYSSRPQNAGAMESKAWAETTVAGLIGGRKPPREIYPGRDSKLAWLVTWLPNWVAEWALGDMAKIPMVKKQVHAYGRDRVVDEAYGDGSEPLTVG